MSGGVVRSFAVTRGASWVARVSAGYQRSDYDDPDPLIDPCRPRRERRTELGIGVEVPLSVRFALDLRAQQTWNPANIANYDFNNSLGSLGVSYRF